MKTAIITFGNIRITPYIHLYCSILQECSITDYDVIFWNRQNIEETVACSRCYEYKKELSDSENKAKKLFYMKKYARYAAKILKKNKYDKVIVLNSLLGVLLRGTLQKNLKGNYIFDIRDHSYEHMKWYYDQMQRLMNFSEINVISSKGFRNFLPSGQALPVHNFSKIPDQQANARITPGKRIHIVFMGNIRYAAAYKEILLKIRNEHRICFSFYGFGEDEQFLKDYCKENDIQNVEFQGAYRPEKKPEIIDTADVIFNAYGTNLHVRYAVSNKFYDAIFFRKPLIVNKGTTMAKEAKGFAYEVDDTFTPRKLLDWYDGLDEQVLEEIWIQKQKTVEAENNFFKQTMARVFGGA